MYGGSWRTMIDVYSLPEQLRKLELFHCFAGELSNFFKFRSTIHQLSKGIESNQKSESFFSSIKESSHEHRFISYDSQGKRGMHVFECSLRDTLALRMSGSQDRYFANLNNIRPTKLSREVDIFKFITEPLPLNTAWYVPRPVLWFFVLFFFFFFTRFARIAPFKK